MIPSYQLLLTLGGILLFGLLTSAIGRHTFLPRATLLLIFGVLLGNQALSIIPETFVGWFEIIADMTLVMVGFLLGGKLNFRSMSKSLGSALWISIAAALFSAILVSLVLIAAGVSTEIAILLGCISSATAPAAILDVVSESEYKGPFSDLLLSIVALDDIWALFLFAVGVAIATSWNGQADSSTLMLASHDIGGALILGLALGFPAAYLTGRLKPGQPILSEALGLVFICGGLAIWLDVSFLIASMVVGAVVSNFARHHEYAFHEIEDIESQFMVIFFILAGATLELHALAGIGLIGSLYIVSRSAGKIFGAMLGSKLSHSDIVTRNWMGVAILPQAGVAIGMALVAANYFPDYRQILLSVVISSTIFFEIIGPVLTRIALQRAAISTT